MTNKELNDLTLSEKDNEYILSQLDFLINQFTGIKENFGISHFADTVCALPNTEIFYNKMSEYLKIWYDNKREIRDKEYLRLNNKWFKIGEDLWLVNECVIEHPIVFKLYKEFEHTVGNYYFKTEKEAKNYIIQNQINSLQTDIDYLKKQL